jgi:hypothetical protein
MIDLIGIDLTGDRFAERYVKTETVSVEFAAQAGEIISLEGPNRYAAGDALVTGVSGTRWSVERHRFDARYEPIASAAAVKPARYKARPIPVLARRMAEPFTVKRSAGGDVLSGNAGDWVLQYAPGDFGVVLHARFVQVYKRFGGRSQ